jgi:hypothetical protein
VRRLPLVAGLLAAAGAAALVERNRRAGRERVSLHFGDGSLLSLERGAPEAERVLAAARQALAAAR